MVQFVAWSSLVAGKRYTDRAGGRASGGGWREPVVHPFGRFRRVSPPHPRPARPRATYYGASAIIPRFRFRSMNGNASPRLASRRACFCFPRAQTPPCERDRHARHVGGGRTADSSRESERQASRTALSSPPPPPPPPRARCRDPSIRPVHVTRRRCLPLPVVRVTARH